MPEFHDLTDDPELKQALAHADLRVTQVERDARLLRVKARGIRKLTDEVVSLLVEKSDGATLDARALALRGISAKALREDDGDDLAEG